MKDRIDISLYTYKSDVYGYVVKYEIAQFINFIEKVFIEYGRELEDCTTMDEVNESTKEFHSAICSAIKNYFRLLILEVGTISDKDIDDTMFYSKIVRFLFIGNLEGIVSDYKISEMYYSLKYELSNMTSVKDLHPIESSTAFFMIVLDSYSKLRMLYDRKLPKLRECRDHRTLIEFIGMLQNYAYCNSHRAMCEDLFNVYHDIKDLIRYRVETYYTSEIVSIFKEGYVSRVSVEHNSNYDYVKDSIRRTFYRLFNTIRSDTLRFISTYTYKEDTNFNVVVDYINYLQHNSNSTTYINVDLNNKEMMYDILRIILIFEFWDTTKYSLLNRSYDTNVGLSQSLKIKSLIEFNYRYSELLGDFKNYKLRGELA